MQRGALVAGLALVVVCLTGWGWLREHDRRVREAAAATRSLDSLRLAVVAEAREVEARREAEAAVAQRAARLREAAAPEVAA